MLRRSSILYLALAFAFACGSSTPHGNGGTGGSGASQNAGSGNGGNGQSGGSATGGTGTGGTATGGTATGGTATGGTGTGGTATGGTATGGTATGGTATGGTGTGGSPIPIGGAAGGLGAPQFKAGDLDPPSHGGTITFQNMGSVGWYPSRRDPVSGQCDAKNVTGCCLTHYNVTSDKLTPWDQDLSITLRGPIMVKQMAVYQAGSNPSSWTLTSSWDDRKPTAPTGFSFSGQNTETTGFPGYVGTQCEIEVASDRVFPCGAGSVPFCPAVTGTNQKHYGWAGSKMWIFLATMPKVGAGKIPSSCGTTTSSNSGWYDAPWVGISNGELVRSGRYSSCNCYSSTDPTNNYGKGCGQMNALEVVNDNNSFQNFDVFSTNFFVYPWGNVGSGPCGKNACLAASFPPAADLIDKKTSGEAAAGALAAPGQGQSAALRRPSGGYRYFIILMDVDTREIQLAIIHPQNIPPALVELLPNLPSQVSRTTVTAAVDLRLPH